MALEPNDLADLPTLTEKVAQDQTDTRATRESNGRLITSRMADPEPSSSLTTYSVGDIITGVPLTKPTGVTFDIFNHELSKELEGIRSEDAYTEDSILNPYDIFEGQPAKPYDPSALGGFSSGASSALTPEVTGQVPTDGKTGGNPVINPDLLTADISSLPRKHIPPPPVGDGPPSQWIVELPGLTSGVDLSIAAQVLALMQHAKRDGLTLGGHSYRDYNHQIELRKKNCGTSHYAIYEMSSNRCSPPTARPGSSNHNRGLAIDFRCNGNSIGTRASPCFKWLAQHAASYGLKNLPSEPWHWSTNGQ